MQRQSVFITGANKGIGFATVKAVLQQHGDVAVMLGSRSVERGQSALQALYALDASLEERLRLVPVDVTDTDSTGALADAVTSSTEAMDARFMGFVNNAGIGFGSDELEQVLATNLFGAKAVCDALIPLLPGGGRVVNVSSASGPNFVARCTASRRSFFKNALLEWADIEALTEEVVRGGDSNANFESLGLGPANPYGLSKACLSLYTKILAREHPDLSINACTPGYIETDLTRPHAERQGTTPEALGMQPPEAGTTAIMHCLFDAEPGSGNYFGSDAKRSPFDRYRAPGSSEYQGD